MYGQQNIKITLHVFILGYWDRTREHFTVKQSVAAALTRVWTFKTKNVLHLLENKYS